MVHCPDVSAPEHGSYQTSSQLEYGSSLTFHCHEGFFLNATDETIQCQADGSWSGDVEPICERVTCPPVSEPKNGEISFITDMLFFNSTVHFACQSQFMLEGSSSLTCTANGTWSAPEPVCRPKECSDFDNLPGPPFLNGSITISPRSVPVTGHRVITVSGLCFQESHQHHCIFYDIVKGKVEVLAEFGRLDDATPFVTCSAPYFYAVGSVKFEIEIKDGSNRHSFETKLSIGNEMPKVKTSRIETNSYSLDWQNVPSLATENDLNISLVCFNISRNEWIDFDTLATVPGSTTKQNVHINTLLIPSDLLSSFFMFRMSVEFSSEFSEVLFFELTNDFAEEECSEWLENSDVSVVTPSGDCPPVVEKAELDGRYITIGKSTFQGVTLNEGLSLVVVYNETSEVAVESFYIKQVPWSMVSSDEVLGSSYYDHYLDFLLPQNLCCGKGQTNAQCQDFIDKRPSNFPCNSYKPPTSAFGYGDPHFMTFDGASYTFNAAGDYRLVESRDLSFQMQGRVTELPGGNENATVFTAVAMKFSKSPLVIVEIDGATSGMSVVVDGVGLNFDGTSDVEHKFFEAVVISKIAGEIQVAFSDDIVVKCSEISGQLINFEVQLGDRHNNSVVGLLGDFDGNANNDVTSSPDHPPTIDEINQFGHSWIVYSDSLFSNSPQNRQNTLRATYSPSNIDAEILCGASATCIYDFEATNNVQLSLSTKQFEETKANMTQVLKEKVVMCPSSLTKPENGYWILSNGYYVDSVVTFGCLDTFYLNGSVTGHCQDDGSWDILDVPMCLSMYCNASFVEGGNDASLHISATNGSLIGSIVAYSCDEGFSLDGPNVLICQDNGQWNSSIIPKCVLSTDPTPQDEDLTSETKQILLITLGCVFGVILLVAIIVPTVAHSRSQKYNLLVYFNL